MAVPVQIQTVIGRCETGGGRSLGQLGVDQRFQLVIEVDVLQGTTAHTDQMMVVVDERLGQFEVGVIGGTGDPADDAASLENLEVSVGRTLGEFVGVGGDLGEGNRPGDSGQRLDEVPSTRGITVVVALQPAGHGGVEVDHRVVVGLRLSPAGRRARGRAGWRTHLDSISSPAFGVNETHSH